MKAELKPEELRSGNTLEYFIDEDDQSWIPTSIDWQDIKWCTEEPEGFNNLHRPIELSEEWLKKAGFEKVSTNYQKGWLLLWGNLQTGTIDFVLNEPNSGKRKVTALKYVHQLQNLYFSLEGNELIFNHG